MVCISFIHRLLWAITESISRKSLTVSVSENSEK